MVILFFMKIQKSQRFFYKNVYFYYNKNCKEQSVSDTWEKLKFSSKEDKSESIWFIFY